MKVRRIVKIPFLIMICGLSLSVWAQRAVFKDTTSLVLAGSGSNLSITRLLAKAFMEQHPEIRVEVPASIGSSGGIKAVTESAIDIGLVSRPLKSEESELGLTALPYARTAVVVGVHPTVTEDETTFEDLVNIYKGIKSSWKGGHQIIVLSREPGDSSILVLERGIPGFREAYSESQQDRRWTTLFTDQQMNELLAKTPFAIGISDLGTILIEQLGIKVLNLNGVLPTVDTIRNGRYPLVKDLAFVYMKDKLSEGARAFLDFARSSQRTLILKDNGYVPLE